MRETRVVRWTVDSFRKARHALALISWQVHVLRRRIGATLQKKANPLRRLAFPIVGAGLGWSAMRLAGSVVRGAVLSDFLLAVGVMAGGTIAIVFAISVFLLQSASDLYSSPHLSAYIHDWREKLIYSVVIVITLGLIAGALVLGATSTIPDSTASLIGAGSLGLVGIVFSLIDWQYQNVREKINPTSAILFLERQAVVFLRRLRADAERMADLVRSKHGDLSEGQALAGVYNQILHPRFGQLEGQLEKLAEFSARLGERQEIGTCKRSITASVRILSFYLDARQSSSLLLPSRVALLAVESDSGGLLSRSFERLNKVCDRFIRDGDEELVVHMINGYVTLGAKATSISFLGDRQDNPIFGQIVAYLGFLVESGRRAQSMEIVFQGTRALERLGALAAKSGFNTSLLTVEDKLVEAATFGITDRHSIIVDQCTGTLIRLIGSVFGSAKLVRRHHFAPVLEKVAELTTTLVTVQAAGLLPADWTWQRSARNAYDDFPALLSSIMKQYALMPDERARTRFRRDLVEFFEAAHLHFYRQAEQLKVADSLLAGSIGRAVFAMNHVIVDLAEREEFRDVRTDLLDRLGRNSHLPSWYSHHAQSFDAGSHAFHELSDAAAKTGILAAVQLENPDVLLACMKSICNMSDQALEKAESRYGYDEPRLLKKACYLGALALKRGWYSIFNELRVKVQDFEPRYFTKHLSDVPAGIDPMNHQVMGLPHHDQLHREIADWRRDLRRYRTTGLLDTAEAMMAGLVDYSDVDWLMFELWGRLPPGSPIQTKLARVRRCLLKVLQSHLASQKSAAGDAPDSSGASSHGSAAAPRR